MLHNKFLQLNENKPNLIHLPDPLLELFTSRDASVIITCSTWFNVGLVCMLIFLLDFERLLHLQWMAICMMWIRTFCVFVTPFKVHPDNIPIRDVLLDSCLKHVFGTAQSFRNDLAMSGHLAHCLILAKAIPEYTLSLWVTGVLISIGMLASKSHYTIDLVIAVLVVPICDQFSRMIIN